MNQKDFVQLYKSRKEIDEAAIFSESIQNNQLVRVLTLNLGTAQLPTNPYRLGFAFSSFYVYAATDTSATVNMKIGTRDTFQDSIILTRDTQLSLPHPVPEAYFDWTAQSGKTVSIIFLLTGQFNLNRVQFSSSLAAIDGTTYSSRAVAGISITSTASIILPADTTRVTEMLQNQDTQSIWVGDSSVTDDTGANPGIEVPSKGYYTSRNIAALYAVSKGTVTLVARLREA